MLRQSGCSGRRSEVSTVEATTAFYQWLAIVHDNSPPHKWVLLLQPSDFFERAQYAAVEDEIMRVSSGRLSHELGMFC